MHFTGFKLQSFKKKCFQIAEMEVYMFLKKCFIELKVQCFRKKCFAELEVYMVVRNVLLKLKV